MARQTIWIEKTKFHRTASKIVESIEDMEDELRDLRRLVTKFKNGIIYEEKSQWNINI